MVGNVALYLALRLAAWLLPLLPVRLAYALASFCGACAYTFFPIPRRDLADNLSHVLNAPANSRVVRGAVRRAFQNDAKNWVDTVRIKRLTPEEILRSVQIEGWENLEAAASLGHGVVLTTLHLGNMDLVGQVLTARGYQVTVPVEHMTPEPLFDFLVGLRTSMGIRAIDARRAPREMLRALRRGELVAIAADRGATGKTIRVPLFREEADLPRGPVSLAMHSGAPLVFGVGVRTGSRGFQAFMTEPMQVPADGELAEEDLAARLAELMERFILRYPDQWLMFSRMWRPGGAPEAAATIERSTEAVV